MVGSAAKRPADIDAQAPAPIAKRTATDLSSTSAADTSNMDATASACEHLISCISPPGSSSKHKVHSSLPEPLQPPRVSQQVHKEECTLCFDDQDGPNGIDVCLTCFNGACCGPSSPTELDNDRKHSELHHAKTGHALVLNIKRRPKPKQITEDQVSSLLSIHEAWFSLMLIGIAFTQALPAKLAIRAETESDKYDFIYTPKCLACSSLAEGMNLPELQPVVDGVIKSMSSAQQSEVKSWEEEILPCQHTKNLVQLEEGQRQKIDSSIAPSGERKERGCSQCDLVSNSQSLSTESDSAI